MRALALSQEGLFVEELNARQQKARARFNDEHNAKRARFSKFSAQNCRVFGAENLKN